MVNSVLLTHDMTFLVNFEEMSHLSVKNLLVEKAITNHESTENQKKPFADAKMSAKVAFEDSQCQFCNIRSFKQV